LVKSFLTVLLACGFSSIVHAQYWQQQVNYVIDVSLNDTSHSLNGFEKIEYINNSPDTLRFIWFHLWPNAYKNDKTAFSEQLLINGRIDFYFSNKEQRGYINRLDFKVNGITAQTEDHPQYIDITKVILPHAIAPGEHIIITTPFHVQLQENFSRGGHNGQSYQITQWYPKPAVYDRKGWHPMPYLDQGEFYSEFGNYDVRITVPDNYVVAATGELQNEEEKQWLQTRYSFTWAPIINKVIAKKGSTKIVKKTVQSYPLTSTKIKELNFRQDNIIDFAWFADKRFVVKQDTLQLPSGKTITAYSYYLPAPETHWKNSVEFIKNAVRYRSMAMGEYPYHVVTAVEAKMGVEGGMEYPTITSISPVGSAQELQGTIEHEVGHNWLQGILANDERSYPWMDEGLNTYYDNRFQTRKKKTSIEADTKFLQQRIPQNFEPLLLQARIATKKDQPINTSADNFTELNDGLVAYYKAGEWAKLLENKIGTPLFDSCMHAYYRRWKFRHPYPEDFKAVVAEVSNTNVDEIFSLLNKKGDLAPSIRKQIKPAAFFNFTHTEKYSYINILPAIGFNQYDKFMIGALIHNYSLSFNKFQLLVVPLYATGSKKLNYQARASYTWFPGNQFYRAEIGAGAAAFAMDEYQPANADKIITRFQKFAPFIRLVFKEKNPLSKIRNYVQFKSFFFTEEGFNFHTIINGPDTTDVVDKKSASRYLNQLKYVVENNRALYPYRAELQLEQAAGFTRAALTGNYFFNYANQHGGITLRLFAGKFFYNGAKTSAKQFETDRFHFNLTGANGYEDYTYSNYFLGRNKFEGTASQQIMMRDGFFKVRTDLLSNKIGKTDNWLSALNFTTDIPKKINPLSILPFKIPLKFFADIGTYAEGWQKDASTSRFLFDAGFQLSLLHETINIYFPVLYSKEYRDYFKSTLGEKHFWKTVSFSIDIQNFNLRKIDKHLDF
jgi:Peptidase family M1 domain